MNRFESWKNSLTVKKAKILVARAGCDCCPAHACGLCFGYNLLKRRIDTNSQCTYSEAKLEREAKNACQLNLTRYFSMDSDGGNA